MHFKKNRGAGSPRFGEAGEASKLLLILAVVVLAAILITYLILKAAERPENPVQNPGPVIQKPVYDQTMGDIKFTFMSARDMGNTLRGSESRNPSWQKDVKTTEKYVKVTIGAQNKGLANIKEQVWDIGNIIDSEGRNFVPVQYSIESWLPEQNLCGTLLKPEFEPTPCTKIYEVSKISKGLKIQVVANKKVGNEYPSDKKETALIDLIVSQ